MVNASHLRHSHSGSEQCRGRKIRCNGQKPCQRCGRLSLRCHYRRERQRRSSAQRISDMPQVLEELTDLRAEVSALKANVHPSNASQSLSNRSRPDDTVQETSYFQSLPSLAQPPIADPLQEIPQLETERLLEFYDAHLQCIYYLADMDAMRTTAAAWYGNTDFARCPLGNVDEGQAANLRLVLANSMLIDSYDHGSLPFRLYFSVRHHLAAFHGAERLDIKALTFMVLISQYYFIQDRLMAAWRMIGFAARTARELGLNKRDKVFEQFPDHNQRAQVTRLFWSIYILDHHWSLSLGCPFVLRDVDLQYGSSKPGHDMPFLRAMVDCSEIVSSAWNAMCPLPGNVDEGGTQNRRRKRLEEACEELREWQNSAAFSAEFYNDQLIWSSHQARCRCAMLYLRANELCIFLCRPMLDSQFQLRQNSNALDLAVRLANDSITVLADLHRTSEIVSRMRFSFNQFLSSALGALALALVHEAMGSIPRSTSSNSILWVGYDLVMDLERTSTIERRLYASVKNLFDFAKSRQLFACKKVFEDGDGDVVSVISEDEFKEAISLVEPLFWRIGHEP